MKGSIAKPISPPIIVPSTSSRASPNPELTAHRKCIMCLLPKPLLPKKKYCTTCSEGAYECVKCYRALDPKYFITSNIHCETCLRKLNSNGSRFALGGHVASYVIEPDETNKFDLLSFLKNSHSSIREMINNYRKSLGGVKWRLKCVATYHKKNRLGESVTQQFSFYSQQSISWVDDDIDINNSIAFINKKHEDFTKSGSGWILKHVDQLVLELIEYNPLNGSSYIQLPKVVRDKKAVLNIKNRDNKCFIWSILAALYPPTSNNHADRVSKYRGYEKYLKTEGLTYPVKIDQIQIFEIANNIKINVIKYERGSYTPCYTSEVNFQTVVNLLLYSDGQKSHYCLINNLSRLFSHQRRHNGAQHFCMHCLRSFIHLESLRKHSESCRENKGQIVILPSENSDDKYLKFSNFQKKLKVPFVIYADLESVTRRVSKCDPDPNSTYNTKYQQHDPCSFAYKVVCSSSQYSKPAVVYRGPNTIPEFMKCLWREYDYIKDILSNHRQPMNLTEEQKASFESSQICHICEKSITGTKVCDHDHISGEYRGAAHNSCNLNFNFGPDNKNFFIPVIFHNLRGYDSHLILSNLYNCRSQISCIPNNKEKYISFSIASFRFIDSLQFLNASLDKLVGNLAKEGIDKFVNLNSHFGEISPLLLGKGAYPYDFMDDESKFNQLHLPSRDQFYSTLKSEGISENKYNECIHLWEVLNMSNMGDFHDHYLIQDVLLLADIFENFRNISISYYSLDPCHYYTSPGLFWDGMLKKTDVTLELFTDEQKLMFVERGIRGGISMICKRYAESNNPYMSKYDPSKPHTYIMPWDANNLYGHSMSQKLPTGEFRFLSKQEITSFNLESKSEDGDIGYILEVDLLYPNELHNRHNDYPLAPEPLIVTEEMLSPYSKSLLEELGMKASEVQKLTPNLYSKTRYVTHYSNLKFYVKQGLIINNIHRILQFKQSSWMESYIEFNTEQRKMARNEVEKDFFKLANNSVFGRTMMNVRNHIDVKLVTRRDTMRRLSAKPNFHSFSIFHDQLIAIQLKKN